MIGIVSWVLSTLVTFAAVLLVLLKRGYWIGQAGSAAAGISPGVMHARWGLPLYMAALNAFLYLPDFIAGQAHTAGLVGVLYLLATPLDVPLLATCFIASTMALVFVRGLYVIFGSIVVLVVESVFRALYPPAAAAISAARERSRAASVRQPDVMPDSSDIGSYAPISIGGSVPCDGPQPEQERPVSVAFSAPAHGLFIGSVESQHLLGSDTGSVAQNLAVKQSPASQKKPLVDKKGTQGTVVSRKSGATETGNNNRPQKPDTGSSRGGWKNN
jgi:hypothetical protein